MGVGLCVCEGGGGGKGACLVIRVQLLQAMSKWERGDVCVCVLIGLAQTVYGISIYRIYAVYTPYNRIYRI